MKKRSSSSRLVYLMIGFILFVLLVYVHIASVKTYQLNMDFNLIIRVMWMLLPLFIIPYIIAIFIFILGVEKD